MTVKIEYYVTDDEFRKLMAVIDSGMFAGSEGPSTFSRKLVANFLNMIRIEYNRNYPIPESMLS